MNRCRPIVAQLTRCSQGYSRHESPTSHVCTREESEQLAPSSITTTSATTGFFSASSTSSLFGCPRTWLQTLRTGTVAAGSRVCVGTEIYLRLREWDCDRQEAFSFLSGSAWTYVPRARQWHRFRSIRGTWQPPCTCGVSPRVHLARTKLRLGNAFVRHRWASRTSLLLSYSLNSLYSFSLLARLDFHSTTPFFFPTPFSSHPTLHAFTYRWIFSPSSPPFEFERSNRPHQVEWSRVYTRKVESHGSRTRPSVGEPAHSTEFPDNRAFPRRRPIPADSQSASDCQHRDAETTVNILLRSARDRWWLSRTNGCCRPFPPNVLERPRICCHRVVRCALAGDQRWTDSHLAAAPRGIAASPLFGASALCGLPPPMSLLSLQPRPILSLPSSLSIRPPPPLSLSLSPPFPFPSRRRSRSPSPPSPPLRAAHIRASWGGMVYHAVQSPSAVLSSGVSSLFVPLL